MTPFEAYKEYLAIKNHFNRPDYDYFTYNGKSNSNLDTFNKRKDKLFFMKLAKHSDVKNFLIANFAINQKSWIKDISYSEDCERNYKEWLKKQQSLQYYFKQDLSKLSENFNDNFLVKSNEHPVLLKKYLGKEICLETLCILLKITGAKKHWDNKMSYDLIWNDLSVKVEKYTPFINFDKEVMKKICLDKFTNT